MWAVGGLSSATLQTEVEAFFHAIPAMCINPFLVSLLLYFGILSYTLCHGALPEKTGKALINVYRRAEAEVRSSNSSKSTKRRDSAIDPRSWSDLVLGLPIFQR